MERAIHIVLSCLCACKHPWNHTQIPGGKQTKGLGCAIHICYRISAPAPSGRNLCPPNEKAEKHQLAAIIPGSPNTSKGQSSMRDHAAWHQCFSRFSGVFSSGFWLLKSCPVPCCSMPWHKGARYGPTRGDPELLLARGTMHTALCAASQATGQLLSAPLQRT